MSKEKHKADNAVIDLEHARVRLRSRAAKATPESLSQDLEVVRGLLDALGLPPRAATAAHGAAIWGSAQVTLPALDIAPPGHDYATGYGMLRVP